MTDGDVTAGQEEDVPLLIGANNAFVEALLVVAAARRCSVAGLNVAHQILSLAEKKLTDYFTFSNTCNLFWLDNQDDHLQLPTLMRLRE